MMQLDISKLVNVKKQPDGSIQCQCPACFSENGQDKTGNHLRIYKNGAFSCVVHQQDREHNSKIRKFLLPINNGENYDFEYIDPKPLVIHETIYPEESLSKLTPDYSYWNGRGIKTDVIEKLQGGLSPIDEKSKLSNRFVFPCRNINGQIIGFSARIIGYNTFAPKWKILGKKNSFIFPAPSISKDAILKDGTVILVEGIGCIMALGQHNIFNTLCLFGLNISGKQISYLISLGVKRIIISTNNEESKIGNLAAEKIKTKLLPFFSEYSIKIHLPYEKDFMCMEDDQIKKWIDGLTDNNNIK